MVGLWLMSGIVGALGTKLLARRAPTAGTTGLKAVGPRTARVASRACRADVGPTKTYAVRTITLPDSLAEELRVQLRRCPIQPSALVFGNRAGNHRRYRVFRRDSWDPAVQAVGRAPCGDRARSHSRDATRLARDVRFFTDRCWRISQGRSGASGPQGHHDDTGPLRSWAPRPVHGPLRREWTG
jgi:hypothetical protein